MKTILIIEDDDAFREMLQTVFVSHRFEVVTAGNTGDGLALTASRALDAVLVDLNMPRSNGLEFCRALGVQSAALDRRLPVWLMTGSFALTPAEAIDAGAQGIFTKPFKVLEVAKQIAHHLEPARRDQAEAYA